MESRQVTDGLRGDAGKLVYCAHRQNATSPSLRRERVLLTIIADSDGEILERKGLAGLRQERILRLSQEAYEQGTLLSYKDLIMLL